MLQPTRTWPYPDYGSSLVDAIFTAMEICSPKIHQIAVSPDNVPIALHTSVFSMENRILGDTQTVLATLTKLKLNLTSSVSPNVVALNTGQVAEALSQAVNLEILLIDAEMEEKAILQGGPWHKNIETSSLEALLHGCRFPRMTHLYLGKITSEEDEIISFVGAQRALRHLVIDCALLENGSWYGVWDYVRNERQQHHIKTASLSDLYFGSTKSHKKHSHLVFSRDIMLNVASRGAAWHFNSWPWP